MTGAKPEDIGNAMALTERLARRDPLRAAVEPSFEGGPLGDGAVALALARVKRPHRFRWQAVALSAWILAREALPDDERREALRHLRRNAARSMHRGPIRSLLRGGVRAAVLAAPALALAALALYRCDWMVTPPASALSVAATMVGFTAVLGGIASVWLFPAIVMWTVIDDAYDGESIRVAALEALAGLRDAESLGLIARASRGRTHRLADSASRALIELTRTVSDQHYGSLGLRMIRTLGEALEAHATPGGRAPWQSARLSLAVLDALERVGDGRAAACVRKVADTGLNSGVRDRASQVLPILMARKEQEDASQRLLRPCGLPEPALLLRPAAGLAYTVPDSLLRPAASADASDPC